MPTDTTDDNPFRPIPIGTGGEGRPPLEGDAAADLPAAHPMKRLGARVVDRALVLAACAGGGLLAGFATGATPEAVGSGAASLVNPAFGGIVAGTVPWFVNAWLTATRGDSVGKRLFGIRVVRDDGTPPGLVRGVLLREVTMLACSACCAGVGVLDAAFVFAGDSRCIHDHLAGTRVVVA